MTPRRRSVSFVSFHARWRSCQPLCTLGVQEPCYAYVSRSICRGQLTWRRLSRSIRRSTCPLCIVVSCVTGNRGYASAACILDAYADYSPLALP